MKICNKCKRNLDESCFSKRKDTKDGLSYICKECKQNYDKNFDIKKKNEINLKQDTCVKCGKIIQYEKKINGQWIISKFCNNCLPNQKFKERICENCGKSFKVGQKPSKLNDYILRKYCPDCSSMNQDTKELICPRCGKTYTVTRTSDGRHFKHQTICNECSKPQTEKECTCEKCGKKFIVTKYNGTDSFKKIRFCSNFCASTQTEFKDGKVQLIKKYAKCECCGKEFELKFDNSYHWIPAKYCSNTCRLKVQRQKLKEKQEETLQKVKETCQEKYGVDYPCLTEKCINANPNIISNINIKFAELLSDNNIDFEFEFSLGPYSYDFAIEGTNYLIEINPTVSHYTISKNLYEPFDAKESDFHYKKTLYAKNNGYICLCIWDWDNWDDIIKLLKQPNLKMEYTGIQSFYSKGTKEVIINPDDENKLYEQGYRKIYTDGFKVIPSTMV